MTINKPRPAPDTNNAATGTVSSRATKHSLLRRVIRTLAKGSGNRAGQRLIETTVAACQALQGIGYGADVNSSGESSVLFKLLSLRPSQKLCVFDVGANKGQFLRAALAILKTPRPDFHVFEPSAYTYRLLSESVGGIDSVTLNNVALGKEAGIRKLFYDLPGSGIASLTKRHLDHFGRSMDICEDVKVETLDQYCEVCSIEKIDLLKLDVEGHELDVLLGSTRMFRAGAISMVTVEVGGANIDTRTFVRDLFDFFSTHQMSIARITPSGYWHKCPYYKEVYEQFRTTNFVCYRDQPQLSSRT